MHPVGRGRSSGGAEVALRAFGGFFLNQVRASVFALGLFVGLGVSGVQPLARYDFLLVWCLGLQIWMIVSGRERGREVLIVAAFHLLGLGLEAYKVRHGSWSYPEAAWTKLAIGVPVYSGFMYAGVASYMLSARRVLGLRFLGTPPGWVLGLLLVAVYANFLLARTFGDVRWPLLILIAVVLSRWTVGFDYGGGRRRMPVLISLFLIGVFVYFAENLCTYLGAWVYPHQREGWRPVEIGKIVSWGLMSGVALLAITLLGGFREQPSGSLSRRPLDPTHL